MFIREMLLRERNEVTDEAKDRRFGDSVSVADAARGRCDSARLESGGRFLISAVSGHEIAGGTSS
jgi:hypothetical protein